MHHGSDWSVIRAVKKASKRTVIGVSCVFDGIELRTMEPQVSSWPSAAELCVLASSMGENQQYAVEPATFELRLLGRARVLMGGEERPISSAKNLLLLARLARTPDRAATREQLAAFLWPGSPPENARASLRQALNRLRASLDGPADPFEADNARIALTAELWKIDLDDLENLTSAPEGGLGFLDGVHLHEPEIEEWLETERRAISVSVANSLRASVYAQLEEHGAAAAIPLALRLIALDGLDESNHRLLMRLYQQAGQRSRAMAQFESLKQMLLKETGEVPDQESRRLAEVIRRGDRPAPTADLLVSDRITTRRQQATSDASLPDQGTSLPRRQIAVVAILAAAIAAASWWVIPRPSDTPAASEARMSFPLPQEPSIAVLPFKNLASDNVPDFVGDGLIEEIIASLTKVPQIVVIDGNSTFRYKDREVAAAEVAEDLGVRFVMDGSIRGADGQVRVTANLVDALEGRQVWAESYDRSLNDVLALQSEIAHRIVTELNVELVSGELARLQENTASDPRAYALFLKAQAAPRSSREDVLRRIRLYEESLELDPGFAAALAAWAIDLARMGRIGMADRNVVYVEAEEIAQKAIEADTGYSGGYLALSTVHRFRGDFDRSLDLVEQALGIAPNDADAIMFKGRMLRLLPGRAEEAIETIKQAMRLNPFYPPDYLSQLSWAYFAAEHYEEAHETGLGYAKLRPNHDHAHWRLAMTYAILGEPGKAAEEVAATLRLNPSRTIARTLEASPYAASNPALMSAEIEAMRAAGFPEK